ncbi:hypothetical protein I203_107541 [Kwoniella mangroviensis CBS 8507]|uniref:hypothetical protein n=1 Tax=Kwoniella mangroviensis CBS 8507 TaxID=1296122 RepID=UPI00080CBD8C|nr:uncharacterized protein I203_02292 [Kwoniella mangroviensis CBS 8507]OCF68898.1 hypothetical protein I203_02292 [Kwoniella mangroviensis CBS 8507]
MSNNSSGGNKFSFYPDGYHHESGVGDWNSSTVRPPRPHQEDVDRKDGLTASKVYQNLKEKYGLGGPEPATGSSVRLAISTNTEDEELPRPGMVKRRVSDIESNSGSEIAPHYTSSTMASNARRSSVGSTSPSTPSSPRFSFSAGTGSSPPSPRRRGDDLVSPGATSGRKGLGIMGLDTALEESFDEA